MPKTSFIHFNLGFHVPKNIPACVKSHCSVKQKSLYNHTIRITESECWITESKDPILKIQKPGPQEDNSVT